MLQNSVWPPRARMVAVLVITGISLMMGSASGAFAAASVPTTPALTLKAFQQRHFSLTLPMVPSSMVTNPPDSREAHVKTHLPTPLLRALYYQSQNPLDAPPPGLGPHPSRSTILAHLLGDIGPARVYTMPHRKAVLWAFGSAIINAQHAHLPVQPSVPVQWQTFIRMMSQHSRITRTVRGTLSAPPALPKTVPGANAWAVITYHKIHLKKMPYLSEIDIIIHQNTVWVLFRGSPKLQVSPNTRIPTALVPAPKGTETVDPPQVPEALRTHFENLLTTNPALTFGTPNMAGSRSTIRTNLTTQAAVRLYHGTSVQMEAWLSSEWHTLNAPDMGTILGNAQGTWHGIRWISIRYWVPNTTAPWLLWIFVTPQGWTAIAAGP